MLLNMLKRMPINEVTKKPSLVLLKNNIEHKGGFKKDLEKAEMKLRKAAKLKQRIVDSALSKLPLENNDKEGELRRLCGK